MKVGGLIKLLNDVDPELEVFVDGYEDGVQRVGSISIQKVKLEKDAPWYLGSHVLARKEKDGKQVLYLSRHLNIPDDPLFKEQARFTVE